MPTRAVLGFACARRALPSARSRSRGRAEVARIGQADSFGPLFARFEDAISAHAADVPRSAVAASAARSSGRRDVDVDRAALDGLRADPSDGDARATAAAAAGSAAAAVTSGAPVAGTIDSASQTRRATILTRLAGVTWSPTPAGPCAQRARNKTHGGIDSEQRKTSAATLTAVAGIATAAASTSSATARASAA